MLLVFIHIHLQATDLRRLRETVLPTELHDAEVEMCPVVTSLAARRNRRKISTAGRVQNLKMWDGIILCGK